METIEWLNSWYASNCNGEWEQTYGVKIDTLDNPGWWIRIDLVDTELEGEVFRAEEVISESNWYNVSCDGIKFEGFGDISKLSFLIGQFRRFVELQHAA